MTDILVEPDILKNAGARMTALGQDGSTLREFIARYVGELEQSDGAMYAFALRNHETVTSKMELNAERISTILAGVATNLEKTQKAYDDNKGQILDQVQTIYDAMGDDAGGGGLDEAGSGTSFGNEVPSSKMPTPSGATTIPLPVAELMTGGGGINAALSFITMRGAQAGGVYAIINTLCYFCGIPNPFDECFKHVAGDWDGVAKAGGAMKGTGGWYEGLSEALTSDAGALFRGWDGPGAERAESYFEDLIKKIDAQPEPLEQLGEQYQKLAQGMYFTGQGMILLLCTLLDFAIAMAFTAAAAANPATAPVALPALAAQTVAAMGIWSKIVLAMSVVVIACELFVGVIAGFLSTALPVEQAELPAGA